MKVGDYVRTKNGYIGKIYNINEFREPSMMYSIDIPKADDFIFMGEDDFKSSPNIIDLIEIGDYVNGRKIEDKYKDRNGNLIVREDCGDSYYDSIFENKNIKSVVTKEQFSQIEYKIN